MKPSKKTITSAQCTVVESAAGSIASRSSRRLADLLENWPKVTIRDVAWIERVVSDLKNERPVPAEGVHKNARRKG